MKRKPRESEDWELLYDFLDEHKFYIEDMLACVCANLVRNKAMEYKTKLMVGGIEYEIKITEKGGI